MTVVYCGPGQKGGSLLLYSLVAPFVSVRLTGGDGFGLWLLLNNSLISICSSHCQIGLLFIWWISFQKEKFVIGDILYCMWCNHVNWQIFLLNIYWWQGVPWLHWLLLEWFSPGKQTLLSTLLLISGRNIATYLYVTCSERLLVMWYFDGSWFDECCDWINNIVNLNFCPKLIPEQGLIEGHMLLIWAPPSG